MNTNYESDFVRLLNIRKYLMSQLYTKGYDDYPSINITDYDLLCKYELIPSKKEDRTLNIILNNINAKIAGLVTSVHSNEFKELKKVDPEWANYIKLTLEKSPSVSASTAPRKSNNKFKTKLYDIFHINKNDPPAKRVFDIIRGIFGTILLIVILTALLIFALLPLNIVKFGADWYYIWHL